jgi:hypothetical protein
MLLPLSSVTDTGGSTSPLAIGTPPTAVVYIGEAPPVVGLAQQASVGVGDGGSKVRGSGTFFFLRITKFNRGVFI